ncbi:hypothetical protein F0562_002264 [Nyssa sinensis]|uniref:Uncharacterized protein n=1 Tax=Nyssa sinensis TaxID=561372 RepID=A0A5J5C969_9ASTE|nr:hypothetical protein F0562_002264 [Nyssa sinensis]
MFVIPRMEWLDLQGHVRSMKRNAEESEFFVGRWLEEHFQSKEKGEKKKEECDFMDVMISLFAKDDSYLSWLRYLICHLDMGTLLTTEP